MNVLRFPWPRKCPSVGCFGRRRSGRLVSLQCAYPNYCRMGRGVIWFASSFTRSLTSHFSEEKNHLEEAGVAVHAGSSSALFFPVRFVESGTSVSYSTAHLSPLPPLPRAWLPTHHLPLHRARCILWLAGGAGQVEQQNAPLVVYFLWTSSIQSSIKYRTTTTNYY